MRNLITLFLVLMLAPLPAIAEKRSEGIAAIVNSRAVTRSDLDDRVKIVMSSAGLPTTQDVLARVRPQVLSALVEEQIKRQEAERLNIEAKESDIDAGLAEIARQNKMTLDEFKKMFKKRGLPLRSLRAQIGAQIGWMNVVTKKIRPQIEVSETDIEAELAMLKGKAGQDAFHLAEIVLPIDQAKDEKNARELGHRLIAQIRKKPDSFGTLARQFSRAAGAAQGGDIGWVLADQTAPEILQELSTSKPGTVIGPFKTPTGLTILMVRERRAGMPENLPSRENVGTKIGMERLDRMQRRYYLDLRSAAFVENRL